MLAVLRVLYQRNGTLMERSCMHWTSDFTFAAITGSAEARILDG
jgi:hypothetical protein